MPQIFQVLRCFKCLVFQIHQCKKSNKWQCKLCGEKQSIKRHYGIGTGKDCRMHVQKLNMLRGEKEEADLSDAEEECDDQDFEQSDVNDVSSNAVNQHSNVATNSKWVTYVDKSEKLTEINEPMYFGNKEVVLEVPQKRKKATVQLNKTENKKSFNTVKSNSYIMDSSANITFNYNKILKTDISNEVITNKQSNSKWDTYVPKFKEQLEINDSTYYDKEVFLEPQQKRICIAKMNHNISNSYEKSLEDTESIQFDEDTENKTKFSGIEKQSLVSSRYTKQKESNSKWCKYIASDEDSQEVYDPKIDTSIEKAHNSLFSLCDDNDLDSILNL